MYDAAFKNIDDTLWKDAGCSSELDYIEQTSWILFLKYLDDFEADKETTALLNGEIYNRIIDDEFRWAEWAAPKRADGTLDYNSAMTGDDLRDFVNFKLFPHLASFKQTAENPRSITYKIGEIFGEVRNKLQSGYALRDVINKVDELRFLSNEDKHELSSLYEDKIKNMGNAGRNGGEYYTPHPLIKSIVKVTNPKIGETVYDGAVGSAGFLCEAYAWMRGQGDNNTTWGDFDYDENLASIFGTSYSHSRLAYRMQNNMGNGSTSYYAWTSFATDVGSNVVNMQPVTPDKQVNGGRRQITVNNLNVTSNHPQVTATTNGTGRLEIWEDNYATDGQGTGAATVQSPHTDGDPNVYDYNDAEVVNTDNYGYGSFQVHNIGIATPETVIGWSGHRYGSLQTGNVPNVGFGNNVTNNAHYASAGELDWTFAVNGGFNFRIEGYIK